MNLEDIPIVYSDEGLTFFQGGCTWIEGDNVRIQLRKKFQNKNKIFWIYFKDEVIAHERVHARRAHLEEKRFEEILAYHTARSRFRKFFGPLFRTQKESVLFLSISLVSSLLTFFSPYFFVVITALFTFFLTRLTIDQRVFRRALKRESFEKLVMMRDQEISNLASSK